MLLYFLMSLATFVILCGGELICRRELRVGQLVVWALVAAIPVVNIAFCILQLVWTLSELYQNEGDDIGGKVVFRWIRK